MPVTLTLGARFVTIDGATKREMKLLDDATSYRVEGFYHSPAFRARRWDGKTHLIKYSRKHGYRAPVGMLDVIREQLDEMEVAFNVVDERPPVLPVHIGWNEEIEPRDYQRAGIDAMKRAGGSGILKMPIRSGKTKTCAKLIQELGTTTVFIVPSVPLLHQARESLEEAFGEEVGIIGDGYWEEQPVTVALIHALSSAKKSRPKDYKRLTTETGMVVFDECHHLTGDDWRKVMLDFQSRYRVGLSATALVDRKSEMEKGVIWLTACCGPIRHTVDMSELIERGHLVRPTFTLYRIRKPEGLAAMKWSQRLVNLAIYQNAHRNDVIARLADEHASKGARVLVVTNRIEQVDQLMPRFRQRAGWITGELRDKRERDAVMAAFRSGDARILVGTVFGEGIDLPEIDVVVIAEGGKDPKRTIQRLRNLTPREGKTEAIVIDFMDLTNPYFAGHSRERLKEYRREPAFRFKVMEV
jgi:superfamily II DNA or RNA helicase